MPLRCCRLNPNNVHFDPELAERYKALSRREKDMLWATDQLMAAHQLAAQQQAVAAAAAVSGAAGGSLPPPEMLSLLNRVSTCCVKGQGWVLGVGDPAWVPLP